MNTLWTFGCSFTAPYFPIDDLNLTSNYDHYKKWRGGNLPKIWPELLSEKTGFILQNRAVGGSSNYLIMRQFLEIVNQIKKNDLLIFGWTNMSRFELVNIDENRFQQILPSSVKYYPGVYVGVDSVNQILINRTHPLWNEELVNWIYFFNLFLFNLGANVYHWTSDLNTTKYLLTNYSWDHRFILPNSQSKTILDELSESINVNGSSLAKIIDETKGDVTDGHFGEFGHQVQCDYFYNIISKRVNFNK